ncbi:MAG: ABC transporter permease, partial [Blastocatellia bacterium]|nr:ABC transporter permease [Blastocatellia bacterium]
PGVQAATIGNGGMPFGGPRSTFTIEGHETAESRRIGGADYLSTVGISLKQGRMLAEREIEAAERVAVINEAAAKLWPAGESPLGRTLRIDLLGRPGSQQLLTPPSPSPLVTIIGIMGNTRNDDISNDPLPAALIPYTLIAPTFRTLAVRYRGDANAVINSLRAQVSEMDKELPIGEPSSFEEIVGYRTAQPRFIMALFSLFAGLGLALAMAGIFSVLSYAVTMRTREIGVRMALGAQPRDILRLIFNAGGKLVGLGLLIGILASLAVARLLSSRLELFKVSAADAVSYSGVVLLLAAVSAVACFLPARRAAKVNPLDALRHE